MKRVFLCAAFLLAGTFALAIPYNALAPQLPDSNLTPGAILPVTAAQIAVPGYAGSVRNVSQTKKNAVYAKYGITKRARGEYEIDHLISLELGGSNALENIWPQSYLTQPWNAHKKDALENRLHFLVVHGALDLPAAQRAIASNWVAAYRLYVIDTPPPPRGDGGKSK